MMKCMCNLFFLRLQSQTPSRGRSVVYCLEKTGPKLPLGCIGNAKLVDSSKQVQKRNLMKSHILMCVKGLRKRRHTTRIREERGDIICLVFYIQNLYLSPIQRDAIYSVRDYLCKALFDANQTSKDIGKWVEILGKSTKKIGLASTLIFQRTLVSSRLLGAVLA